MIKGLSLLQLYNSVEFSIPFLPCSTLSEKSSKEIQFFKIKLFYKMSTTRSQKRKNDQQSTGENVSEGLISPIIVRDPCPLNQDDEVAGPSRPKSPRIENSLLESLRTSLKEEITSEIKNLLIESQKEMLKLLKPEMRGIIRENTEEEVEEETRSFYTPTKSVRISSTQNDPIICRNSKDNYKFHFNNIFVIQRFLSTKTIFNMGNRRNRRTRRATSQSSDREENASETSFVQGNATLINVSGNANNIFDRNLGSELTEPSQVSNEIEVISQRLTEQNNDKMSQIEEQLNNKFEEILKEIRTNKNYIVITDEEDAENNQPGPSNSKNKGLRNKHASNTTLDKNKNQDDRSYPSEMGELGQPYTPLRITEDTLDESIIINENRHEKADHHNTNC